MNWNRMSATKAGAAEAVPPAAVAAAAAPPKPKDAARCVLLRTSVNRLNWASSTSWLMVKSCGVWRSFQ